MESFKLKLFSNLRRLLFSVLGYFDLITNRKNNLFILCYHSVGNDKWRFTVAKNEIEKQMKYLLKTYDYVNLEQIEKHIKGEKKITKPSFSITFDDGYKSILELIPVFEKLNINPTAFVLADTKKANRAELENEYRLLNTGEVKKLIKAEWEIGSHTLTHSYLPTDNNYKKEIIESKKKLEKELGIKISYFAYPKGGYSKKIINEVKAGGYKMGLSVDDGEINKNTNLYVVPRIGVDGTHAFNEFKLMFSPSVCKVRGILKDKKII